MRPCKGVHTFGMAFAIDLVYLDKDNKVLLIVDSQKPNSIAPLFDNTNSILELPAKEAKKIGIKVGDQIQIDKIF